MKKLLMIGVPVLVVAAVESAQANLNAAEAQVTGSYRAVSCDLQNGARVAVTNGGPGGVRWG